MDLILILLALSAAILTALALVLTQFGLRSLDPLTGASISIPTTALLLLGIAPLTVDFRNWHAGSVTIFALAGVIFPVAVTLLTFASNRQIGPTLTGALGNLSPLFAVGLAVVLVGEVPTWLQLIGAFVIFLGAIILLSGRTIEHHPAALWIFGLPVAAAFLRGIVQPVVKIGLANVAQSIRGCHHRLPHLRLYRNWSSVDLAEAHRPDGSGTCSLVCRRRCVQWRGKSGAVRRTCAGTSRDCGSTRCGLSIGHVGD